MLTSLFNAIRNRLHGCFIGPFLYADVNHTFLKSRVLSGMALALETSYASLFSLSIPSRSLILIPRSQEPAILFNPAFMSSCTNHSPPKKIIPCRCSTSTRA
ncbi:hypothetical protein K443DRAFT_572800 [Laccaria amethystina LaAM-08-1]|uniref:Uncharacterized protein n=1 Tax=Laccaria amethystina LaAM-08-1 TaxID=1095629 RepID=A0A0C9X8G3_9AGAR|nr:hypothetical protein K443DRAFT_572800 [Laccaria amethystina LaAM-08-1]